MVAFLGKRQGLDQKRVGFTAGQREECFGKRRFSAPRGLVDGTVAIDRQMARQEQSTALERCGVGRIRDSVAGSPTPTCMPSPRTDVVDLSQGTALEVAFNHAVADRLGPDAKPPTQRFNTLNPKAVFDQIVFEQVVRHHEFEGGRVAQMLEPSVRLEAAGTNAAQIRSLGVVCEQCVSYLVKEVEPRSLLRSHLPIEDRRLAVSHQEQGRLRKRRYFNTANTESVRDETWIVRRWGPAIIHSAEDLVCRASASPMRLRIIGSEESNSGIGSRGRLLEDAIDQGPLLFR